MDQISDTIFKAYDIRGLVDSELSEDIAYRVGRAVVQFFRSEGETFENKKLVVAYDMRPTSPLFHQAVARGIEDEGVDVVDIGLASTPLFNFACANFVEHAGGVMVTASHNPASYNGFKITRGSGVPVGGTTGMQFIKEKVKAGFDAPNKTTGTRHVRDVTADYCAKIFEIVPPGEIKPLKVIIDAGNGMGKATFPAMIKQLPLNVEFLFLEPDGTFPNHEANPLKTETLATLQKKVVELGADFGFALDGDADRIGLVDENGAVVDASFVGALIGLEVLKKHPGSLMFYDLRSSQIIPEVWAAAGGKPEMCVVGHANIKKQMAEQSAAFASELSLHVYYRDMFNLESSDLSFLYVAHLLSESGKKLSELVTPLKKYCHSKEINFEVRDPRAATKEFEKQYASSAIETSHLDGLWLRFGWGWVNVRPGGTEPVLRLNLETKTESETAAKVKEFSDFIAMLA